MSDTQTLHAAFAAHISQALDALEAAGILPAGLSRSAVAVEPPRDPSHGDLATNAAMVLAKPAGTNPRTLAEALAAQLVKLPQVAAADIAGPGFINLRLTAATWIDELRAIAAMGADYVIDANAEDAATRIKEITGGRGADVAIDNVANACHLLFNRTAFPGDQ